MRARLIKNEQGLWLLFSDGQMMQPNQGDLRNFLCSFNLIRCLKARVGDENDKATKRWDVEQPEMSTYPGETIAYVTDAFQLVLFSFEEFEFLFKTTQYAVNEDCLSIADYSKKYKKSAEQVKKFCRDGRIPGAKKLAGRWVIPHDAPYPADNRYRNRKF